MARPKKASDAVYNARRRYRRASERYLKKAQQATGNEQKRYMQLANTSIEKAISLYDDPTKAQNNSAVKRLSRQLNPKVRKKKLSEREQKSLVSQSFLTKERKSKEERRQDEAAILMSSDVGNSIYAAMSDIWQGEPYANRDDLILDYFGAESMADIIEMLVEAGIDLYADEELEYWRYEEKRTAIELAREDLAA